MSPSDRPPLRAQRRAATRRPTVVARTPARADEVREIEGELESWRDYAVPDLATPLDAEAVARLVGGCLISLGLDEAAATSFTIHTVHFYRRKEILDPPEGRTSAARYTVRHLWQAVGARLAGQLALLTLAEAREAMAGRSERVLLTFVAERVLDARARQATRRAATPIAGARPLAPMLATAAAEPRPTPNANISGAVPAIILPLPGEAWCVVPAAHPANRSPAAARALGKALTDAIQAAGNGTSNS
jgi:DNA-binding transcriptional MerR regulator